ncbi:MAG: BatD family protein [Saprospiraceae bacterium]
MKSFFVFVFSLAFFSIIAQSSTVEIAVSRDTVLLGNAFYIQYTFDSQDGQFLEPEVKDGVILEQSFSSNTSITNGEVKAVHKQKYLIQPKHAGVFSMPGTVIKSSNTLGDIEVPMVQIVVKPNPDTIEEGPEVDSDWQFIDLTQGKTLKRKSKRI